MPWLPGMRTGSIECLWRSPSSSPSGRLPMACPDKRKTKTTVYIPCRDLSPASFCLWTLATLNGDVTPQQSLNNGRAPPEVVSSKKECSEIISAMSLHEQHGSCSSLFDNTHHATVWGYFTEALTTPILLAGLVTTKITLQCVRRCGVWLRRSLTRHCSLRLLGSIQIIYSHSDAHCVWIHGCFCKSLGTVRRRTPIARQLQKSPHNTVLIEAATWLWEGWHDWCKTQSIFNRDSLCPCILTSWSSTVKQWNTGALPARATCQVCESGATGPVLTIWHSLVAPRKQAWAKARGNEVIVLRCGLELTRCTMRCPDPNPRELATNLEVLLLPSFIIERRWDFLPALAEFFGNIAPTDHLCSLRPGEISLPSWHHRLKCNKASTVWRRGKTDDCHNMGRQFWEARG